MAEQERKEFDPTDWKHCQFGLCERSADVQCPYCGWVYCRRHWDERMHEAHERLRAKGRE